MSKILNILGYLRDQFMCKIMPGRYLKRTGVNIGNNVVFYALNPGTLGSEPWVITIGNNVYITAGVQFITHDGGTLILRKEVPDLEITKPITVGNDVYIGLRTMILPGVNIGNRVIIGAGSIVTKDIPDNSVAAGVPAKVIKSVDEYLEQCKRDSLHIGHLSGAEKAERLKEIFKK